MIKCFFTNLQDVTMSELYAAKHSIHAAVAWINFKYYGDIFFNLLCKEVEIKILLNDDGINQRYLDEINSLKRQGAHIRLARYSGIMHHKFCVIDKEKCLFGSFNWTDSANIRNIEDLNICNDYTLVKNYMVEFKGLWELSKSDIKLLRNPLKCDHCHEPLVNILFMEPEDDETKIEVIQQCACEQNTIFTKNYNISVYNNYLDTIQRFDDDISMAEQSEDKVLYYQLVSQQDFVIANYLSSFRHNRMGCPIIHAVGVKKWESFNKHDGQYCYKIIWKERNTDSYIEDEYPIM
jgi:hypothetical protein